MTRFERRIINIKPGVKNSPLDIAIKEIKENIKKAKLKRN